MPMSWTGVLPALITFLVGGLLAVLLGVVLQRVLRKITGRTTSTSNQFIAAVLVDTLPPLGWVLSASLAWQILPTSTNSDRIAFGLAKLLLVVLVVRLVNRIGIRLLQRGAQRSSDEAVANLLVDHDQELADRLQQAAAERGQPVSTMVAEMVDRELRLEGLRALVAEYEAEFIAGHREQLEAIRDAQGG